MQMSGRPARAVTLIVLAATLAACGDERSSNDPSRSEPGVILKGAERDDWKPGQDIELGWEMGQKTPGVELRAELAKREQAGITGEVVVADSVRVDEMRADKTYTTALTIPEDLRPGCYSLVQEARLGEGNRVKGASEVRVGGE